MGKLNDKLEEDLLLTKAFEEVAADENYEDFECLSDAAFAIYVNGDIVMEEYLDSIMKLTAGGYVESSIKSQKDIEEWERSGFDIKGVTEKGNQYIEKLGQKQVRKQKISNILKKADEKVGAFSKTETGKFIKEIFS